MTKKTRVIIRTFPETDETSPNETIALFPDENWNNRYITSYMCVGQHSEADLQHVLQETREATEAEIAELLKELEMTGYDNLEVITVKDLS